MKDRILSNIPTECPWRDTLYWYDSLPSTNDLAKVMAKEGAPHGTVIIADTQTSGRGRLGRVFQSPAGSGVYLSLILRPQCPAKDLMHLTCAVGVAMVRAIERAAGITPGLKWINDLVFHGKKLGGILTELAVDPKTGIADYAVVGIGINCRKADFTQGVENLAISLEEASGKETAPEVLAGHMIHSLWQTDLYDKAAVIAAYKALCVTLGKQVMVLQASGQYQAEALDIDCDGGLLVRCPDGQLNCVSSGEVSVRGLWDYM